MPSVHEVLLEVVGDSSDAQRALAEVRRSLAEFSRDEAEVQFRTAGVRGVLREIARVQKGLAGIDKDTRLSISAETDVANAQADLELLRRDAIALQEAMAKPLPGGRGTAQTRETRRQMAEAGRIAAEIAAIESRVTATANQAVADQQRATEDYLANLGRRTTAAEDSAVRVEAMARQAAQAEIDAQQQQTAAYLAGLGKRTAAAEQADQRFRTMLDQQHAAALRLNEAMDATVRVDADTSGLTTAMAELDRFEADLFEIRDARISPEITLRAESFLAQIALVRRQLDDVREASRGGLVDARGVATATATVARLGRGVTGLVGDFGRANAAAQQSATGIGRFVGSLQGAWRAAERFAGAVRVVQSILLVLFAALIGALLPGVVALGTALGGAAAAAGALGASLAGALAPGAALATGALVRLKGILDAKKALEAQDEAQVNLTAQANRAAAAAEEARVQALNAVRDAQQSVVSAERALQLARRAAREELENAVAQEQAAGRAVTEAQREIANAVQAVREARLRAHEEIAAAIQRERDAEQRLADVRRDGAERLADASYRVAQAQDRIREAAENAYDAMADAIRRARDAQLELAQAQLGVEDAMLRVEKAELAVAQASQGVATGLADARREFEQFDRLAVDLGPVFTGGVQAETTRAAGGESPEDRAMRLQEALLELRRARLAVTEATNRQEDAENNLADANAESARFAREGINAYRPYRDAVVALADAQRDQRRATEEVAQAIAAAQRIERQAAAEARQARREGIEGSAGVRAAAEQLREAQLRAADAARAHAAAQGEVAALQRQGIANAPGVISATEGLRDAHEQLAEAQRRAKDAGQDAFAAIPAQVNAAEQALAKLTATEREFVTLLGQMEDVLRTAITPGTDAIYRAIIDVLRRLPADALRIAQDLFLRLGIAWGQSIRRVGAEVLSPAWMDAMAVFGDAAVRITSPVTEAFIAVGNAVRDIAVALMPDLLALVVEASSAIQDLMAGFGGVEGAAVLFAPMVAVLRSLIGLGFQLGRVVWNFIVASLSSPAIRDFVDTLARGARQIADFISSAEGTAMIQGFFERVLPSVLDFVEFIGRLVLLVIQLAGAFAPLGGIVLPILNMLMTLLNGVMAVLAPIIGLAIELFRIFVKIGLAILGMGVDLLVGALSKLGGALETATGWLRRLLTLGDEFSEWLGDAVAAVVSWARDLPRRAREAVEGMLRAVRERGAAFVGAFRSILQAALNFIRGRLVAMRDAGLALARSIGNGVQAAVAFVRSKAVQLVNGILAPFRAIASLVGRLMQPVIGIVRGVLNNVLRFVNFVIDRVNWVVAQLNRVRLPDFLGGGGINLPAIGRIPYLAEGGIATGPTAGIFGEAGDEAILPLTNAVFQRLGAAIAEAMTVRAGGVATATAAVGGGGEVHQHFHIPPAPAAHGQPDPRHTAALLGREMRKNGRR